MPPMPQAQPVAPLTIIAIFSGIIEASALATLPFLSESSQNLYTWFLVGFPFFLTALFFLTLNFNSKSFYNSPAARTTHDSTPSPNSEATAAVANDAPEVLADEPLTFMFSGPEAQRMMERQLLHALAQPPGPTRTWRFCNLDKRQCAQLSISALDRDIAQHHC